MKLDMQENQVSQAFRTFLLRMTLTEEDMVSCSSAFRKPKNAEEEEVNRKCYPKVNTCSEKVVFEMAEW